MTAIVSKRARVGIVRLQLFKLSETFIPAQVRSYARYEPFYLGRKCFGEAPADINVARFRPGTWNAVKGLVLGRPGPWLDALGRHRPALLHAHFAIDAAAALPLVRRVGVPLVTTLHAFDVNKSDRAFLTSGKPNEMAFVFRRRALQREGALFVCVSDFIRQRALSKGFPADRTVTLPIGVDTDGFTPIPQSAREPGLIVHVARLVEKKGTSDLLSAFARVIPHAPHANLVVVGDGPLRGALEAQAQALDLQGRVQFVGARSHRETIQWISKAAVLAVPSVTAASGDVEGLPTVIFEAGALGVPAIGTLHAGIPEAILEGVTGYLVRERAVEGLAERLAELVTNPARAFRLGEAARDHMHQAFNIVRQTEKLESLYDRVLDSNRLRLS